jgi:hypothetical membrane protein
MTTTLNPVRTRNIPVRIAAGGLATFFAASLATATLTPGYRSTRDAISALAAMDSPYAWLMITGFLAAATGLLATSVAVWRRYAARPSGKVAAGLLVFAAGLMTVAGLARQDCSEAVPTCVDHGEATLASTHFWVHQYVSLLMFLVLVAVAFVLIRAVRRTEGLGYLKVPARIVAWTSLLVTASAVTVGFAPVAGLVQRPYLALLFGWPILLAGIAPRAER